MFKIVFIGTFVLAFASAVNLYELDNLIEYEDMPLRGISLPYPYQDNRIRLTEPEHYHAERYEPVVVSVPGTPVANVVLPPPKPSVVSSIASSIFSVAASIITIIINNAMGLIIGSLTALGICKLTPICSKLSDINSLGEASMDFKIFATPERIARATEFVKEAIRKYRSYQKK